MSKYAELQQRARNKGLTLSVVPYEGGSVYQVSDGKKAYPASNLKAVERLISHGFGLSTKTENELVKQLITGDKERKKMSDKELKDLITTQNHYNVQDEGGTEQEFREGLNNYSHAQLVTISEDGFEGLKNKKHSRYF